MNEATTTSLIDTALAAGAATALDPEERALQELVLAVRDDAPRPDPGFELRMNARVAAGFPPRRKRGLGGRVHTLLTTRPQLTALGAAASLLIALVVALSAIGGGSHAPGAGGSAKVAAGGGSMSAQSGGSASGQSGATGAVPPATDVAPQQRAPSTAAAPAEKGAGSDSIIGPTPVPPAPGGFVGGRNRKVERSAALVLAAPKDQISQLGDQVIAVTDRYRGIVLRSSVTEGGDNVATGSFDLRIPAASLRPALRDLSALADVVSRTENADDVTASFVNARTRLEELNAERRGLLRRLEHAATDRAASAIRARLRIVNAQIDSQTQVLAEMKRRTSYASVSVTLQPKQGGGGGGGISDGARDLRDSLIDAANLALRVLGVALPIAIVLGLLWAAGGWLGRRRREAVLGPREPRQGDAAR